MPPHRPPWWPPDEPFPPRNPRTHMWRAMRGRFFWRIGAMLILLGLFACGAFAALIWLLTNISGNSNFPATILGIFALVFLFAGLFLAGRSLRRAAAPLGDVMEATGRVAEGDYSARVTERGPREVRALARSFNAMTGRLQANDESRRSLLADVTHELRTPLTVIQGNLEGLLDNVYPRDDAHLTPILDETRILSRLIDDLRTLALAESGALKLQKEQVDLAALIAETAASFRAQADAAGVELIAETGTELMLTLDPARIREVLENLIANALRYTPRGGRISVQCTVNSERVEARVSDTGSGIAPEDLPRVFERWQKSRDSRGTGLGLAIAKNLIAAHGGEIFAESDLGKGTTIRFTLPTT